ncbi:enoyl-CoA hydratase [Pseudomonas duriflava]|uniref:Enoyl-CoA hydratase n=1 Tax=Pseudomonas duriflava TaxID=459528 RepID=A0A562QAT0_9PSED|nr:crotonase/enoyl-CoA hydratase family protein [Pseudomonas duriflava]TWI53833.1 enoyl-CoA hydratase [Pseudomonas duriflava]
MTGPVTYHYEDPVATLTLNHGKVNALSPDVIAAIEAALDRAEQDRAVVVIKGQPGIFSGGYDLKVMMSGPKQAIDLITQGSHLTRRLLAHPFPIIAACSGHAIAKGAFLLLSVDYRIGIEGPFTIGFNEVAIGMTMHHAGVELARDRLTKPAFQRAVIGAELFAPHAALSAGFLDEVVTASALDEAALQAALRLGKLNMTAHSQTKLKARAGLLAALDEAIALDASQLSQT